MGISAANLAPLNLHLGLVSMLSACQPAAPASGAECATDTPQAARGLQQTRGAPRATGGSLQFPYAENFEELKDGQVPYGWLASGDETAFSSVLVTDAGKARSGTRVVHLSDDSPQDAAELKASFGTRERGMVLYSLLVSAERPADAYMTLAFGDASTDRVVDILFTQSGTIRYRAAGGSLIDVQQYTKGDWHDVGVVWDTKENNFVLTIDGAQAGSFRLAAATAPTQITFKVGANAKTGQSAHIDDVQLIFQ